MKHTNSNKKVNSNSWEEIEVTLPYAPPLDFESLLGFYITHEIGGTEKVTNDSYERVFKIDGVLGFLSLIQHQKKNALVLKLLVQDKTIVPVVVERVRNMFDLDLDHAVMVAVLKK